MRHDEVKNFHTVDEILDPLDTGHEPDSTERKPSDDEQHPWFNTASPKQKDPFRKQ